MAKSPFIFTYQDLIDQMEKDLTYMNNRFPGMVHTGQMNDHAAKKRIEMQKTLVGMLKKHKRNQQLNLEDLFHQSK